MPRYEYPCNERIRTLLRLEDLFIKVFHHIKVGHEFNHHCALLSILQILDVVDRADLKADLIQELERQRIGMQTLIGNPVIEQSKLNEILSEIEITMAKLKTDNVKLGQHLRDNEWLMSIKQRAGIPGGVCEFDVPSYHFWLNTSAEKRRGDFELWLEKLMPVYEAIEIILHILRGSGATMQHVAHLGSYQQMLGGTKPAQMLIVEIDNSLAVFPEISANKYAINIRFSQLDYVQKPKLYGQDITFKLTLCNL